MSAFETVCETIQLTWDQVDWEVTRVRVKVGEDTAASAQAETCCAIQFSQSADDAPGTETVRNISQSSDEGSIHSVGSQELAF